MLSVPDAKGVVAAGHEVTAQAAADILKDGGNAFDATVAALAASCVCEPILSSLGGGGFLMAHQASSQTTELYDFFVQTPHTQIAKSAQEFYAIHADFGPATQEFHIGAGSTATPGFIPGLFDIHETLCSKPLDQLFEPAIRAATQGITVSAFQSYLFTVVDPILTENPDVKAYFAPQNTLLQENDIYKNYELAECLSILARDGKSAALTGKIAQKIIAQNEQYGGHITYEDLKSYQVIKRKPLNWQHQNAAIALNPAPAASGTLIAFGLGLAAKEHEGQAVSPQEMVVIQNETNNARNVLSKTVQQQAHFDKLLQSLHTTRKHNSAYRGTTHISVIDGWGNAASTTVTNGEGNGRIVEGCGFMLNNMLGEEDVNPDGFQNWVPNTRLSSMMAPTLMQYDNGELVALGSGGSNRIRTAVLQVILNIQNGMLLADAVAAPRIHVEKCGKLSFEDNFTNKERQNILAAFSDAEVWPDANMFFGGVHVAQRKQDGTFVGVGDARRSGISIVVE